MSPILAPDQRASTPNMLVNTASEYYSAKDHRTRKFIPLRSSSLSLSAFVNCADCRMSSAVSFIMSVNFNTTFSLQINTRSSTNPFSQNHEILENKACLNDFLIKFSLQNVLFLTFLTCICSAHARDMIAGSQKFPFPPNSSFKNVFFHTFVNL